MTNSTIGLPATVKKVLIDADKLSETTGDRIGIAVSGNLRKFAVTGIQLQALLLIVLA